MIEIKRLSKFYGPRQILRDIDLRFKPAAVTGVVGPNACGKSTLMKCLLGLVLPTSGEVWVRGGKTDAEGNFRKNIGYMPQTPIFPRHLCLDELLNLLEKLRGERAASRDELIHYFGLEKILRQPFEQLSGGTQQKVAAVIAFMFNAPIVILDEPTVGLDPVTAVRFKDLVAERARIGATIILVSHIMGEVEEIVDEMAFMNEGEIIFSGPPSELLQKTNASQLERAVIHLLENKAGK